MSIQLFYIVLLSKDEEPVDYPMGVRQAATIVFPDPVDKKFSEKETNSGEGTFAFTLCHLPGGLETLKCAFFEQKKKKTLLASTRSKSPSTTSQIT